MKFRLALFVALMAFHPAGAQTKKYQIAPGLTAAINHNTGTRTVQVLMPGVETVDLDLAQAPDNTFMIKTADYNFDGYKDFAMMSVNQLSGTQVYEIFLYHPADKSFEALELPGGACESFGNVRLSAGEKILKSGCRNGPKASQDVFKWTDPFTLELVKSTDNSTGTQLERAEEKAEVKSDKVDQRKEKQEQRKDKALERKEKVEQRKDEREDKDDGD